MVRTKVFVGNLAFSTKEAELAKHFESAGKVISANIITRGPRSLGYGFVEMESEQDAENAVKQLDKKEIDGRPINVEVAKPREENATNAQGQDQAQGGQRNNQGQGQGQQGGNGNGTRPPRNNRRPRQRRTPGQQGGNQVQGQQGGNQVQGSNQNNQGQRNNQGQGQQGGNKQATSGQQQQQQQTGQPRQPRTRQPRQRPEGEDTRTPSTTTLFVANLPYALDNDAFEKVLKDGSLSFKTATVSTKKKSGLSKGFGFIEFDTEVDQQKALAALQGKKITDRDIVVKVALTGGRDPAATTTTTTGAPADVVTPTNKPSEIKANVAAVTTKQAEKPTTPKQDKK